MSLRGLSVRLLLVTRTGCADLHLRYSWDEGLLDMCIGEKRYSGLPLHRHVHGLEADSIFLEP